MGPSDVVLAGAPQGEICDIEGRCVDAAEDELFKLTTKGGKLVVETERVTTDTSDFDAGLIFEQDPVQIIDALLPLYLNSTLLRALQVRARGAQATLLRCFHAAMTIYTFSLVLSCHLVLPVSSTPLF